MSGPAAVDFAENGEAAVAAYTATGLVGDQVEWSLSGDDGAAFEIAGGVLAFAAVPDYEKPSDAGADNDYEVTVTASDASAASASIDVTVTVSDVDDPSIVVIMADDAGYEVFGAYGTTQYSTPRLDAIASSGVRFDNAFSKPLCTPSRVAIMTGKSNVRNYSNWITMVLDEYTFGDLFSDAGYATAIAGKWQLNGYSSLAESNPPKPAGHGFDTYCLWYTVMTRGAVTSRFWYPTVECDGALDYAEATNYGPDKFVDFLLDFIESNQERPFFAYYPMVLPHGPFHAPPGASCDPEDDVQCLYEKMVARTDHNVGLIYDKLETLDLLDNTLLLFTTDNGTPKQMASHLDGEVLYGGKSMPTDGGTRVPLIAHVPGQSEGRVISDLVDIVDILPTVADAAGIDLPGDQTFDGMSFWDQLQGNEGTPRQWIYTYYWPQPHKRSHDRPEQHPEIAYARDQRYKLYSTGELFDVTEDRLELFPLPDDDSDSATARAALQAVLDSMPSRGSALIPAEDGFGTSPDGVRRPRQRPVLRAATVTHDELTLSYVGQVVTSPAPPAASFTVQADGTAVAVSEVSVSQGDASTGTGGVSEVALTLESEVVAGQDVTVSYVPGSDPIRHANRFASSSPTSHGAAPLSGRAVVNLTPPNDPLTVTGPASVDFAEGGPGPVATYGASDPQGDTVSWSPLSGVDAGRFSLGDDGVLSFRDSPDFESPGDSDSDNVYEVTVAASDGRLAATVAVSVTVTNVDEPGVVTLSHPEPEVGSVLSAWLSDADGLVSESWSWQRSRDGSDWGGIDGAGSSSYTPVGADVGWWLRATVAYGNGHGAGKRSRAVSGSSVTDVDEAPSDPVDPVFVDPVDPVDPPPRRGGGGGGGGGAPAAAEPSPADEFSDLSEAGVHEESVLALASEGVLAGTGCREGRLCPWERVRRWEMAVWLIRALEDDEPAAISEPRFADVEDGVWWARYVERLAELETTLGCRREPLRYCPDRAVNRGQMASLMVRALDLEPADAAGFTDIEGSTHADNINALAAARITVGCNQDPLRYCPRRPVTRAEMASFLARALGLVQAPESN